MILAEYCLYSFQGRSGTTLIRNQLGKYDENLCLITGKQFEYISKYSLRFKLSTFDILESKDFDIKTWFSKYEVDVGKIKKVIYKAPLYKLLNFTSFDYLYRVKTILVLRHPVSVILSSSKDSFLKVSDKLENILNSLKESFKELSLEFPQEYLDDFENYKNSVLMQNAVLYKISFLLYKNYFTKFYNSEMLIFVFEDFLNEPVQNMLKLLEFLGENHSPEFIEKKLKEDYFEDVVEEGGIIMSANLDKNRVQKNNLLQEDVFKLEKYLKDEISFLNYQKNSYPRTEVIVSKTFFKDYVVKRVSMEH